jgi:hypothetical protein
MELSFTCNKFRIPMAGGELNDEINWAIDI